MIGRRGFITGLVSLVAAPAIVRVASIMPVKVMPSMSVLDILNQALLDTAERQINPPWLSYEEVTAKYGFPTIAWREINKAEPVHPRA